MFERLKNWFRKPTVLDFRQNECISFSRILDEETGEVAYTFLIPQQVHLVKDPTDEEIAVLETEDESPEAIAKWLGVIWRLTTPTYH